MFIRPIYMNAVKEDEGTGDIGVAVYGCEVEGCCKGVEPEEPTIGVVSR
jgi:hypothetical protein